jgi:hypothetical protein
MTWREPSAEPFLLLGDKTRVREKNKRRENRRCSTDRRLQEALEDVFAEACLPGCSKEEAQKICFERSKEVHRLVNELVGTYVVSAEWEFTGSQRAYETSVYVGPDGIRKGKGAEWHRTEVEAEAPRPPSQLLPL